MMGALASARRHRESHRSQSTVAKQEAMPKSAERLCAELYQHALALGDEIMSTPGHRLEADRAKHIQSLGVLYENAKGELAS